jgi:hypothetical protein
MVAATDAGWQGAPADALAVPLRNRKRSHPGRELIG